LRWRIVLLVTAAIAISYLDRQTLPVAIRAIANDIPLTNQQFSYLQSAFLLAYAFLYAGGGKLTDVLGTRKGFMVIMIFWSLACASHALATSFTRDWYEPYINPASTSEQTLRAVRWATVWFSLLMIVVASTTAYLVIVYPKVRIIPIVLSIYGYTYGSVLGIFLAGMLTKSRGNDFGNIIAMIIGFIIVAILSGLPNNIARIFGGKVYIQPTWLPVMEFPWWICFGTIVTFFIAVLFRTGREHHPPGVASGQ